MDNPSYQWISSSSELNKLVEELLLVPVVFLDTEFIREKTFEPILALVQLSDGTNYYLIEPEAIRNSKFKELLKSETVRKVFHSGSEDCEVFYRFLNIEIINYWDTQIVEGFCSGESPGYANTLKKYANVELEKGESRSDWLQRPLTQNQEHYAVNDVIYLSVIYQAQLKMLENKQINQDWVNQDSKAVAQRVKQLDELSESHLDIKNVWRLNQEALMRLFTLAHWREVKAREKNQPKSFILKNDVIFDLARKGIGSDGKLPFIDNWHPVSRSKYSVEIMQLLLKQGSIDLNSIAVPLSPKYWQQFTPQMKAMREYIEEQALKVNIASEIICSKKLLRNQVKYLLGKSQIKPIGCTDWREKLMGEKLKEIFGLS